MKKIINTNKSPAPIGPYNQAVKAGNTVYISGQIPLDHASGKLVDSSFSDQVNKVFDNLTAIAADIAATKIPSRTGPMVTACTISGPT